MDMQKVVKLLVSRLGLIIIFLPLLGAGNLLRMVIPSRTLHNLVGMINANFDMIILFIMFFFLFEFFRMLKFPFSLPYPIFNAFSGIALSKFLIEIAVLVTFTNDFIPAVIKFFEPISYILLFVIITLVGFVKIIMGEVKPFGYTPKEIGTEKLQ